MRSWYPAAVSNSNGTYVPLFASPVIDEKSNLSPPVESSNAGDPGRPHRHGFPVFRRRAEASAIELFYDLFFVANLNVFTSYREIGDLTCE